MIEFKSINTSHVTVETLKAFNEWLADIFRCRIGFIDKIKCWKQYAAETAWKNTRLSMSSVLNNIPVWKQRLLLEYLRNNYQRTTTIGDIAVPVTILAEETVRHQSVCRLNLRTNQTLGLEADGADVPREVKYAKGEVRIPIPEGYDGNTAFVELLVPFEVISEMLLRKVGGANWDKDSNLIHPLIDPMLPPGTFPPHPNARCFGFVRNHALLFYQRYTRKNDIDRNILKIDVAKSKAWVSIKTHADSFSGPFDEDHEKDVIEPWVEIRITAYKYGAQ